MAVFETGAVFTKFMADTSDLTSKIDGILGKFKKLQESAGDTKIDVEAMGNVYMTAGAAGFTALAGMVGTASFTTDNLKKLAAQTNTTGEEFENLKNIVRDIKIQGVGEGLESVTNAVSQAKTIFGELNEETKSAAESSLWYQEIFDVETQQSLKAVDSIIKSFGGTSKEAFDLMTFVRQEAGDKAQDLEDTFWEYSVHFKDLGFQQKEMAQILTNSMKNGNAFNYDKIGDAMKEFKLRFYDLPFSDELTAEFENEIIPSFEEFMSEKLGSFEIKTQKDLVSYQEKKFELEKEYQKLVQETAKKNKEGYQRAVEANEAINALREIGMNPDEFLRMVKAGGDEAERAINQLMNALSQIEDQSKLDKYSTLFFGTQTEDLGRDFVKTFSNYQNIDVEEGRLDKAKDIYLDKNVVAELKQTGALLLDIGNSIGQTFVPMIAGGLKVLNGFLKVVADLLNRFPLLANALGIFIAVFSGGFIVQGVRALGIITKLGPALAMIKNIFSGLMIVLRGVAIFFAANPIGLIIGIITLIAVVISKTIGWKKVLEGVKLFFTDILPKAILHLLDFLMMPIKLVLDWFLMIPRLIGKITGKFDIPWISQMKFSDLLGGGKSNVNVTNNINTNTVDRTNITGISNQLGAQTASQAAGMGYA